MLDRVRYKLSNSGLLARYRMDYVSRYELLNMNDSLGMEERIESETGRERCSSACVG